MICRLATFQAFPSPPGICNTATLTGPGVQWNIGVAVDGLDEFEQKLCLMLPYRLPRESSDALVRLNSGLIWFGGDTLSWSNRAKGLAHEEISMHCKPPAAHGWQEELHGR